MRWLSSPYLRTVLALLGLGFVSFALLTNPIPFDGLTQIGWVRIGFVTLALGISLGIAAWSWSILMGSPFRDTGVRYLVAMPSKHIPGGLGLPLSQLNYEVSRGTKTDHVLVRMIQHFFVSVGAGGWAALLMWSLRGALSSLLVFTAVLLAFSSLAAHPRVLRKGVSAFWHNAVANPASVQSVSAALLLTIVGVLSMGFSFAVLINGLAIDGNFIEASGAFILSWAIGYAAVPVPAGIGVREAILVGALPTVSPAAVILASILLRLLALFAELALAGITRVFTHSGANRGFSREAT